MALGLTSRYVPCLHASVHSPTVRGTVIHLDRSSVKSASTALGDRTGIICLLTVGSHEINHATAFHQTPRVCAAMCDSLLDLKVRCFADASALAFRWTLERVLRLLGSGVRVPSALCSVWRQIVTALRCVRFDAFLLSTSRTLPRRDSASSLGSFLIGFWTHLCEAATL